VAAEISSRYPNGNLKLVGVLKGLHLLPHRPRAGPHDPRQNDILAISSFSNHSGAPGVVRIAKDLDDSIEGEDVMLVEDIVDTGFTARYLLQTLAGRGPNSIALCTLLDRRARRIVPLQIDYRCFEIPDRFVIGFGLDYKQLYRNLDYIAVLKP
jgi:hypoxanthine phosphoribosyltransferase